MKTVLLICFILGMIKSQAELTNLPGGALESYKAYLRGLCAATGTDCDLSQLTLCWDDDSALKNLNMTYQGYLEVLNTSPRKSAEVLKDFMEKEFVQYFTPIADALSCEEKNLAYASQLYSKFSPPGQGLEGTAVNILHYASVRSDDLFTILKNSVSLADQGNFEAMGLLDGNFMSQASAFKMKESTNWRTNAKNSRGLFLKGICEALGLECPVNSLNCMDEQVSAIDLNNWYEWFKAVATKTIENGAKSGIDYLQKQVKESFDQYPQSAVECDKNSPENRLISEKLGMETWGIEWHEALIGFLNEFPESSWHYKAAELRFFENNDMEGVGIAVGLDWFHVAEWRRGRLVRKEPAERDEL